MSASDAAMLNAINKGYEWHSGETTVTIAGFSRRVWIMGQSIAVIERRTRIVVRDVSDSLHTRRLNAILKGLYGESYNLHVSRRSTYVVHPKTNRMSGKVSLGHTYLTVGQWWEVEGPDLEGMISRRTVVDRFDNRRIV